MILTDTHTHLYSEEFNQDREQVIKMAINKGVQRFFLPNIDSTSMDGMFALEKLFPENCFPMLGLHPCSVKENYEQELEIVEQWLSKRKFCAVGEIGIDLYWAQTFIREQEIAFRKQVEWAVKYELPIVIHSRNSFDEIYTILKVSPFEKVKPLRGIFHCFTGNLEQAKKAIELGFYLGIGGVLTFKNSGLDKVVEQIDLKHLVLETDAPYLAPVPHRGKRNESSYLVLIAQKLADIKNISIEEVAAVTTENSKLIFGI